MDTNFASILGMLASIGLPLFNIPLMIRLYQRKSSEDLSLTWVIGVFSCLVLMMPSGLSSNDFVFKVFSVMNLTMFSGVTFMALYYRKRR